jgi:hypothetical protein
LVVDKELIVGKVVLINKDPYSDVTGVEFFFVGWSPLDGKTGLVTVLVTEFQG